MVSLSALCMMSVGPTVLVKEQDIAAVEIDCVSSAQSGHFWPPLVVQMAEGLVGMESLQPPPTTMILGAGMLRDQEMR